MDLLLVRAYFESKGETCDRNSSTRLLAEIFPVCLRLTSLMCFGLWIALTLELWPI